MTRDDVNVTYPTLDGSQSVGSVKITKSTVTQANGVNIPKAFANKNNSLLIVIDNTANADKDVTFKASDAYPNGMLGDYTVSVKTETAKVFQIYDISRFENKDGSLKIDFATGFTGTIFAVAKPTALNS